MAAELTFALVVTMWNHVSREHLDGIGHAVEGVLAASEWPEIAEIIASLPADRVLALAEALWDRAWRHLTDGDHELARQVCLLGELVDRVALVGADGAVEAFLEFGTLTTALQEVEELAAGTAHDDPTWFAARHDIGLL
jgi:hypothetical protein